MDWFGYSLGHDVRQVRLAVDVVESNILLGHLLLDQVPPQGERRRSDDESEGSCA